VVLRTQVAPAQQPEHFVGSHLQAGCASVVSQNWSGPHAGFEPHMQPPLVQRSASRPVRQLEQATPLSPHCIAVLGIWQTPLTQHPLAHVMLVQPEHCPCAVQFWPVGQLEQVTPPRPHAEAVPPS
jgi:hypothetical protein